MSLFDSLFGQQALRGNSIYVDTNQYDSALLQQQLANQQTMAYQQQLTIYFPNYDPPLLGPTKKELEKYPGLRDAWEQFQVVYALYK